MIEVTAVPGPEDGDRRVRVRNSAVPEGPVLEFALDEWEAFVKGVRAGEFDPVIDG